MADLIDRLRDALEDRYAIEREIGQGGMATVYLADDARHHRKVAVKVLQAELARTLGPDRFLREIEIAAQLQHPHILPLYDSGEADGFLYYVMPYVEGESLRERLVRDRELPIPEAIRILRDTVDALAYAHARGVVHRDMKPDNVMLSGRHALVTDFGVAKAVSEATGRHQLTTAGVALGTPSYMAPEQAVADPNVDHRADIYAVGAVGYELLTGRPPFVANSPQALLAAHVTEAPEPVTHHRQAVPPGLAELLMRCLAKKAADRPQKADQVLEALESLTTPSGGITPTDTQPLKARAKARSSRTPLLAVATAILALIVVGALFLGGGFTPVALGQLTHLTSAPGLEMDPAISPDGNMVAYTAGPPGAMKVFVRQVSGGRTIPLTDEVPGHHRWPQWSPDGSRLAFQAGTNFMEAAGGFLALGGAIYTIPALGGAARLVVEAPPDVSLFGPAWSPSGDRLAYVRDDTIVVQPAAGGATVPVAAGMGRGFQPHSIAWSPDGTRLAVVSGNPLFTFGTAHLANAAPSSVWIVPLEGDPVRVTDNNSLNMSPAWLSDRSLLFVSNQDGTRDLYQADLDRRGAPRGTPVRLSTGLNPHTISITQDGSQLALSVYSMNAHVREIPLSARGSVSNANAPQLTAGTEAIEGVAISNDGVWIAYDSDRSGNQDIWKARTDGTGDPIQLTTDPADDFVQGWSPDGRELSLHSFRNGNRDVFVMSSEGGPATQVTPEPSQDLNPAWGPDGNCLAFQSSRTGQMEIYVACRPSPGAAWDASRQVTTDGGVDAQWSPDGRWIAHISAEQLRIIPPDGGDYRVVVGPDAPEPPTYAIWSPDSRTLYYKGYDANRVASIWAVSVNGGTPRRLLRFDDANLTSYRREFDTDGRRFVFTIGRHESDVWTVGLAR